MSNTINTIEDIVNRFAENKITTVLLIDSRASGLFRSSIFSSTHEVAHALVTGAHKIAASTKGKAIEEFVPIDEKRLQEAVNLVNEQKNDSFSQGALLIAPISDIFELALIGEYAIHPLILGLLTSFIFDGIEKIQDHFQARKIYEVVRACLNVLRYLLALIRRLLGLRLIDSLVSALHRIFYIPHSTLHMPKDTDEDSSIAYRFEPFTRAITGLPCLLLSS